MLKYANGCLERRQAFWPMIPTWCIELSRGLSKSLAVYAVSFRRGINCYSLTVQLLSTKGTGSRPAWLARINRCAELRRCAQCPLRVVLYRATCSTLADCCCCCVASACNPACLRCMGRKKSAAMRQSKWGLLYPSKMMTRLADR